ncbi:unnamed protein product [Discula destructiva]
MSGIVSLVAWTFLPDYATRFLHKLYYGITIRAGSPHPQPGTPRFAEHYRRIYLGVICLYLLFSLYEADWNLQRSGDLYSTLGVLPNATEKDMKRRYRQLSAALHPDKAGPDAYNPETYILLQTAHATLTDEAKRFAYDRFGPAVLAWKECLLVRDYIMKGALGLIGYYGIGAVALYAFPKLGYFRDGIYWRWMAFLALGVFEVYTITRPDYPPLLQHLVNPLFVHVINPTLGYWIPGFAHPPYLPYQAIAIARQLSITLSIALNQMVPFLTADTRKGRVQMKQRGSEEEKANQSLVQLNKMVRTVGEEANQTVQLECAPFTDLVVAENLRLKMKRWLVNNTIRNEPMTKDAINQRIMRRRQDAPAGAQGNGARLRASPSAANNGDL